MTQKKSMSLSQPSNELVVASPLAAAGLPGRSYIPFSTLCSLRNDDVGRRAQPSIVFCAVCNDL